MLETIFIIVFVALYAFLAYKNLTLAIFFIIAALPSYQLRFQIGPVPFTILEIMILIIFIVWLIRTWQNKLLKNIELGNYKWPMLVLIIASIVGLAVTPDLREGLGIWKAYILEPLLFFVVFINTIRTREQKRIIFIALGILALYVSAFAIFQFATGWQIPSPWQEISNRRSTSLFPYPNAVGLLLAPIASLFLGFLLFRVKNSRRSLIFNLLVFLLAILAIIFSKTEGAILAVFVCFVFLSLFLKSRWVIIALVSISLAVVLIVPQTQGRLEKLFTFKDTSGDVHLALWQGTYNLLKDRPLIGSGLAGFPQVYEKYKLAKHTELLLYPHNIFLDFWVEMGAVGLISLVWLIILYLKDAISIIKNKAEHKKTGIILVGILVTIFIYGLVDSPYFKNDLAILFWTFFALTYAIKHNPQIKI